MRILKIEWNRNVTKTFLAIILVISLSTVILTQLGIVKYKSKMENSDIFIALEQKKTSLYPDYFLYYFEGFRLLTVPGSFSALFFNSMPFSDLNGHIDRGTSLKLSKPQVGPGIFEKMIGGFMDFSWFISLVGTILMLIWGFNSFREKEYIKYLLNSASIGSVFLGISLARVLLIFFIMLLQGIIICAQFLLNGLSINFHDIIFLLVFILLNVVLMSLFLITGSIFGMMKKKVLSAFILAVVWLALVVFWPEILNSIFANKALSNLKQSYAHEEQTLKIGLEFEKSMSEYFKSITPGNQINTEIIIVGFKKAYKKIENLELEMVSNSEKLANRLHLWSIFNPATFCKAAYIEMSSMGYNGYIDFYKHVVKKQSEFVDFYIQKRFIEKKTKVEPFVQGDEYIFKAKSSLPKYFVIGLLFNIFILLVLTWVLYNRLKKALYPASPNPEAFKTVEFKLLGGKISVYDCTSDDLDFPAQLYNALSGDEGFQGTISLDGENIPKGEKLDFFYIPKTDAVPGNIKNRALFEFFAAGSGVSKNEKEKTLEELSHIIDKRYEELSRAEKIELLCRTAALKKAKIYLLENLFYSLPRPGEKEVCKKAFDILKEKDTIIVEMDSLSAARHFFFYTYISYIIEQGSPHYQPTFMGDKS